MVVTYNKIKIVFTLISFNLFLMGCSEPQKTVFTADENAKEWEESVSLPETISNGSIVSFGESLFLISGNANKSILKLDGEDWVKVGEAPGILNGHSAVVFKEKMYLLGGESSEGEISKKVFSSVDGVTWEQSGTLPAQRTKGSAIVFKEKIFYYGGVSNYDVDKLEAQSEKTIYVSEDGVNWTTAGYLPYESAAMSIENYNCESLVMVGGSYSHETLKGEGPYSSVYSSEDGVTWEYLSTFTDATSGGSLISL